MSVRTHPRSGFVIGASWACLALLAVGCVTNRAPVAVAGDDRAVEVGDSVTLTGAGSTDPEADALTLTWLLEGSPPSSAATLSATTGTLTGLTPDVAGTYTVLLTVSDGALTDTDRVDVVASDGLAVLPISDQMTLADVPIDVPVELVADDPDGITIVGTSSDPALVVDVDIEPLGTGAFRSVRVTPVPLATGTLEITVTARAPDGVEASTSFGVEITAPFERSGRHQGAEGTLFASSVGISGSVAVVGAPDSDAEGVESGSARLYTFNGTDWVFNLQLPPAGPVVATIPLAVATGDHFGTTVAIDGAYVLVGAPGDDDAGTDAGAVYVYMRCPPFDSCNPTWSEVAKLTANDAAANDAFGSSSLAISGDHAIVGAPLTAAGNAAYVFRRNGEVWSQVAKLTANDVSSAGFFGQSVAISGDHAIVGAMGDDAGGVNSGSAYVFRDSGGAWNQVAKLTPNDAADFLQFGKSVAMSGEITVVGANMQAGAGAAYVFRRSGDAWSQVDKLTENQPAPFDNFGWSVAIDGDDILVGVPGDDFESPNGGAAYLFRRHGDRWLQLDELEAESNVEDYFGTSVAISGDHAIAGAPYEEGGTAYYFSR